MFVVAVLLAGLALILDSGRGSDAPSERVNQLIFGSLGLATLALLLWFSQQVGPAREEELDSEAIPLCPNCLVPYQEGMHFCATCSVPLTFFAGTGGYEHIYAQAWAVGKAIRSPQRRVHFLGLLLVLWPYLWGAPVFAYQIFFAPDFVVGASQRLPALALYTAVSLIACALLRISFLNLRPVLAQAEDAPARPIYGAPPYWTFDVQGILPTEEDRPEAEPGATTPAAD